MTNAHGPSYLFCQTAYYAITDLVQQHTAAEGGSLAVVGANFIIACQTKVSLRIPSMIQLHWFL